MTLETEFDLGQYVYAIAKLNVRTWIPCSFCSETGYITGADEKRRICPECYGRHGENQWLPEAWQVRNDELPLTVGRAEVKVTDREREERYMMVETGVGTGSVYDSDNLFASLREAKAACKKRNTADRPLVAV